MHFDKRKLSVMCGKARSMITDVGLPRIAHTSVRNYHHEHLLTHRKYT